MRLLELKSNGHVSLTKDLINNIPPYAILSHTWGNDIDEVTFKDLTEGSPKAKTGYNKILFCAARARTNGLQYIWIDTCCIDKSNNAELSEAIISMFRWYRDAAKCYAYLTDVSTTTQNWTPDFRKARWFTRGWTLQELIAPSSVEFFSVEGELLGSKRLLEQQVHEITGIAVKALRGHALSEFSVSERLSWTEFRQTTREEDKAYSLLGIFNVNMPPLYGEGTESAFRRLHEEISKGSSSAHDGDLLDQLPHAIEAPFNAYQRQHDPSCLPETRVDLLQEIQNWVEGPNKSIFWLNGLAGTGKSTIARTVARRYFDKQRLGASFFFSRGGGDVGHTDKFITSIALQLASSVPSLAQHIRDAINERRDIATQSLQDQWQQLILRPLSKLRNNGGQVLYMLVIDALDECDNENDIRIILRLLSESLKTAQLQVFLTSRPEVPIRNGFFQMPDAEHRDFILHNISSSIVDRDISTFFKYNLKLIGQEQSLDACWPDEEIIKRLIQLACGRFIWAATACRFIREGLFADERVQTLLEGSSAITESTLDEHPDEHLNKLYTTVLKKSIRPGYSENEKKAFYSMLQQLLGSIVVLFAPLSVSSLHKLLSIPRQKVDQVLKDFHAILDISKNDQPLRLHHPSFRDFLLDKKRCEDPNLRVDEKQAHQKLATHCLQLISTSLKQNMCGVDAPSTLVTSIKRSRVEQILSPEIQYACQYWTEHVKRSNTQLSDNGEVHIFLQKHLLHWLEALGWIGKVSEGMHAIAFLESFASSSKSPLLYDFIHDTKRFVHYTREAIEHAPLQAYCALAFAPAMSKIKENFKHCIPSWIRRAPLVRERWDELLMMLEGHSGSVWSVAFSPDDKLLASGSLDTTARLWDHATGATLHTLKGHSKAVVTVAFSLDGNLLASGSVDKTIRLWNVATGALLQTLVGHVDAVHSVAFSSEKLIASGSRDKTIRLWDADTGAMIRLLKTNTGNTKSARSPVTFSPDGKMLASVLGDNSVGLLDPATGSILHTLEGNVKPIWALAFSPDGKLLASGSEDSIVRIWDAATGAPLRTVMSHVDVISEEYSKDGRILRYQAYPITNVAFSPDSKLIASSRTHDRTIRFSDATTGALLQKIGVLSSWVWTWAIAISQDGRLLASGAGDKIVRLWETAAGVPPLMREGHRDWVLTVAFSSDGKLLASGSKDGTIRLWEVATEAPLLALEGHLGQVVAVAFSPDSRLLASNSLEKNIKIWDIATGALLYTLKDQDSATVFSPSGKLLASRWDENKVMLWDAATKAALQEVTFDTFVSLLSFLADGSCIEICSPPDVDPLLSTQPEAAAVSHGIMIEDEWIRSAADRMLWLPPDYRPSSSAVHGSIVGLGHQSGHVSVLELDFSQYRDKH